ncbi:uncharacterized protein [Primulina eburnea]|uniref:uncharacterized protein n=1 Tax=Primulina eburnea TaxID=1245227 RepID=UPI003C6C9AF7
MVKPGSAVPEKIRESTRFYPYFKDCIGAIDGTHIPVTVFGRDTNSYRNRHGTISQNVLAVCNFDLEFIYVLSGWEGSAHDSNVLTDALSRNNRLKVTQCKFFLVDGGYPNRRQFLAPFRGVCYHLQDFTGQGRHPEDAKELFNLRHASLRNVIERLFGIFKSRFKLFKTAPPFKYTTQTEIVLACAALHNFFRKECRSDEFQVETEIEVPPFSSEQVYEDDNFGELFDTQEQQRTNANAWRDAIANQMWSDVDHIVDIIMQPATFSDMKCDIPDLKGDNYKIWKERILLQLGWMDIDYVIRKDEPSAITENSIPDDVDLYEK